MTKEQIEKIFASQDSENGFEEIVECVEDQNLRMRLEFALLQCEFDPEEYNDMQKEVNIQLLKQINESDQYECFEQLGLKIENQSLFCSVLECSQVSVENAKKYLRIVTYCMDKIKIIKATNDVEFIKQCIEDVTLGLSIQDKCSLVEMTNDSEYVKTYINKNSETLTTRDLVRLICATKDCDYIKTCVESRAFSIVGTSLILLIQSTESPEFIKQCVEDEKFGFSFQEKIELIAATKDADYIKRFIEQNQEQLSDDSSKMKLIQATGDIEYIKHCIESEMLEEFYNEISLVQNIRDPEYIMKYIKKHNEVLTEENRIRLIKSLGNIVYIDQCIKDKTLMLSDEEKTELILSTKDKEYMVRCISDESLNLPAPFRLILAQVTRCEQEKQRLLKQYEVEVTPSEINLPSGMTVGVEIESEGEFSRSLRGEIFEGWKAKDDPSLENGVEVISPILRGTCKDAQNIYKICNILNDIGQEAGENCGGHVHIGADYLTGTDSYANLLVIWSNAEKVLYQISNEPYQLPRNKAVSFYAKPISRKIEEALQSGSLNLETEEDLQSFIKQLKDVQENRHFGVNFLNVNQRKKNTIEFRLPNGTLSPEAWIENINLFGGIVKAAEEIAQIQRKVAKERTDAEKQKLDLFEAMNSGSLTEEAVLNTLLMLTVGEHQREVYKHRYKTNKELMQSDVFLEFEMDNLIAEKPIKTKKMTGDFWSGLQSVTGQEIIAADARLSNDRAQLQETTQVIPNEQ